MAKKLVVFYSRTGENYFQGLYRRITVGNTAKAARMIADETGADLFELQQKTPYSESYRPCTEEAKKDLENGVRPELVSVPDLSDYDEIYLGYPIYWGTFPMAVLGFLESADLSGKTIHPFCTHEGSGLGSSVPDLKKAASGAAVTEGLAIHGSSVDASEKRIRAWA